MYKIVLWIFQSAVMWCANQAQKYSWENASRCFEVINSPKIENNLFSKVCTCQPVYGSCIETSSMDAFSYRSVCWIFHRLCFSLDSKQWEKSEHSLQQRYFPFGVFLMFATLATLSVTDSTYWYLCACKWNYLNLQLNSCVNFREIVQGNFLWWCGVQLLLRSETRYYSKGTIIADSREEAKGLIVITAGQVVVSCAYFISGKVFLDWIGIHRLELNFQWILMMQILKTKMTMAVPYCVFLSVGIWLFLFQFPTPVPRRYRVLSASKIMLTYRCLSLFNYRLMTLSC